MTGNFHEQFDRGEGLTLPSDRSTGLVLSVALFVVAIILRHHAIFAAIPATLGAALALMAWFRPAVLKPLTRGWFKFGLLLNKVVSPIVLFILFALVIVPYGLVMQLFHDPLKRNAKKANPDSYWLHSADKQAPLADLKRQF